MARFDTLCLTLTIASLSVLGVWPQSPPSPPPCVLACSDSSAQSASCSSTDVNCICNSDVFANDVVSCVVSNCSATDAAAAAGYFDALCSGATSSSVSLSGVPSSTGSFSTTTGSAGSVASSPGSTSGSSLTSSQSSQSGLSSSTGQSSVSSTTSGASRSSTSSSTGSSTSASFTTPSSTTPPVSHAVRGHISMSFAGVGFALALAVALVAW